MKKADFSNGPYRWLTVVSPEEPEGAELQLALNDNPAAKAYKQAMSQQGQPSAMFFSNDLQADYERMKARAKITSKMCLSGSPAGKKLPGRPVPVVCRSPCST